MNTDAWLIGLHLISAHVSPGYELVTPGVYVQAPSGLTAGLLRNSEGRASVYLGWTTKIGPLNLTVGGITGYQRARIVPMLVPSVAFGPARLSVLPNPWGASALHLSYEWKLR